MSGDTVGHSPSSTVAPEDDAQHIGLDAQRLSVALGLGLLLATQPCHGYVNCCSCERCECRALRFTYLREQGYSFGRAARAAAKFAAAVYRT